MNRNPSGRARFKWIEDALASQDLTEGEKNFCTRLGLHLNDETGQCFPSDKTLAIGIGRLTSADAESTSADGKRRTRNAMRDIRRLRNRGSQNGRIGDV